MSSERKRDREEVLILEEKSELRRVTGSLMWVSGMSRPDIASATAMLAGKLTDPTIKEMIEANNLMKYLKDTKNIGIKYQRLPGTQSIVAFGDAAFQNLRNGGSQGGQIICIAGENFESTVDKNISASIIAWKSNKISRVVRSTFSAELLSQMTNFDLACWIRTFYEEILFGSTNQNITVTLFTDCHSLVDHAKSLRLQATEKRLYNDIQAIREGISTGEIDRLIHIPTSYMIADGLTKPSPKLRHLILKAMDGIITLPNKPLIEAKSSAIRK